MPTRLLELLEIEMQAQQQQQPQEPATSSSSGGINTLQSLLPQQDSLDSLQQQLESESRSEIQSHMVGCKCALCWQSVEERETAIAWVRHWDAEFIEFDAEHEHEQLLTESLLRKAQEHKR